MGYLEDKTLRLKYIINADDLTLNMNAGLDHKLEQKEVKEEEENDGITDFEKKVVKKRNKCAKKRNLAYKLLC